MRPVRRSRARILFVHQNFPGQFRHLSALLAASGDEVVALTMAAGGDACGARLVRTRATRSTGAAHPWARDFDTKLIRGEATFRTAVALRQQGFVPDLIVAHPGWGDTLFLKDVWPEARLALYCEFFYRSEGGDINFDPEFAGDESALEMRVRMRLRNLPQRLQFDAADAGLSPTRFQADSYPAAIRDRIAVIHDGIDTDAVAPGPASVLRLAGGRMLAPGDELVTFVARTLEPYRGIHILLRAWPAIQRARPAARLVIVGSDGTGYGTAPPAGKSWASIFLQEMGETIDPARILFLGPVDYSIHLAILRLSSLHIYLTYPFVLSWSMMEAMATGCAVLGSDTAPVREFLTDGETGMLTPFLDPAALAARAIAALGDEALRRRLGAAARAHMQATVDLRRVVQPQQLAWIDGLLARAPRAGVPPA
jgi:glycosyltransferase involved in cell wall biosynthesis